MRFFAERILPVVTAVLLILLLEPWNLQWWMIDIGIGAILCAFAVFRDPGKPEPREVWVACGLAIAAWAIAWLVARYLGLTLHELVHERSVSKHIRRIPDYAVVFATFAALFAAWSIFPPSLLERRSGT